MECENKDGEVGDRRRRQRRRAASSGEDIPGEHAYAIISVSRTDYHYVWMYV